MQVQGKDPSVEITQDIVEESEDERFDEMSDSAPPIDLPPCELSRLEEINEVFYIVDVNNIYIYVYILYVHALYFFAIE